MRRDPVLLGFALVLTLLAGRAGAGVLDAPLPTFSDAQPAQRVAVLSTAVKSNALDIDVVCTNLGTGAVDIGLEVFDHDGVRGNTIGLGNGAILAVGAGATVTIGTTNTAALHEDVVIALEAPVVNLANGSARVVATSAALGCTAFAVDKFHSVVDQRGSE